MMRIVFDPPGTSVLATAPYRSQPVSKDEEADVDREAFADDDVEFDLDADLDVDSQEYADPDKKHGG